MYSKNNTNNACKGDSGDNRATEEEVLAALNHLEEVVNRYDGRIICGSVMLNGTTVNRNVYQSPYATCQESYSNAGVLFSSAFGYFAQAGAVFGDDAEAIGLGVQFNMEQQIRRQKKHQK